MSSVHFSNSANPFVSSPPWGQKGRVPANSSTGPGSIGPGQSSVHHSHTLPSHLFQSPLSHTPVPGSPQSPHATHPDPLAELQRTIAMMATQIDDLQAELPCTHGPDYTQVQEQLESLQARMDVQVAELWQEAKKSPSVTSAAPHNLSDLAAEISQLWQAVAAATTLHTPAPMPAGPPAIDPGLSS